MPQLNDLSRSLVALDQDATVIAVIEMSQAWAIEIQPLLRARMMERLQQEGLVPAGSGNLSPEEDPS